MIDRIKKIIEVENIGLVKFAEEIGIGSSALSHYLRGRNKVSLELVTRILERFRGIDPEWLIFGRGEMYKSADQKGKIREPDLFSSPTASVSINKDYTDIDNDNEISAKNDTVDEIMDSKPLKNDVADDFLPPQTSEPQTIEPTERPAKAFVSKTIEKIIVMYSDSTFDCYLPNGHRVQ